MFLTAKDCNGEGECKKACPTQAIRMINGKSFSCINCGICYESCPNNAIFINKYGGYVVDRAKCNGCGMCQFNCPIDNITIKDGIVYGICSRCGVCVDACPNDCRVDGYALNEDKHINFIKSINKSLPPISVPTKSKNKIVSRDYIGTDESKCIYCGRCEDYCPTQAIEVYIDQDEGICRECRLCEDVCPTNAIKKFNVNHDLCSLCMACYNACPNDAIRVNDFKVNINTIHLKPNGFIVSCLNCGLCAELMENGSFIRDGNKNRYNPLADITEDAFKDHIKAIEACPVSTLIETDEITALNENGQENSTLCGFCVLCGNCLKVCQENARVFKTASWDGSVSEDCISCGTCCEVCPEDAIILRNGTIDVNLDKCILCENCAVHCPKDAIPKNTSVKKIITGGFNYIDEKSCISCGLCYQKCPEGAILKKGDKFTVDDDKCIYCGACKNACPSNAFLFERKFKNSVEGV